jgi:glutaredoxin
MKRAHKIAGVLMTLCAAVAHAQLYKWTGPDGKVNYSDTPPASPSTKVETRNLTIGDASAGDFPFEVMQAMKSNPVTLYTTRNCIPCDDGRKHLRDRGIPFSEKTVNSNEDVAQFRKVGGDTSLPLLVVGRLKERGYEPGAWDSTLSSAGYPDSNKLPKNYRQPVAQPAAPKPVAAAKPEDAAPIRTQPKPGPTELPPPTGNAPPGFRF